MMNLNRNNAFTKANIMGVGSSYTENGALSYATTGSELVDQFGKAGTARCRSYQEVWDEQVAIWAEDKESALRFPFYLRMITRKDNYIEGNSSTQKVQRGMGVRDEAFKRLLWIAAFHPFEFYNNLWVLPVIGSWKDLWTIMCMAEDEDIPVSDFKLDHKQFFKIIALGLADDSFNHKDLVKKYLPRIRSNKKCNTQWAVTTNRIAKELCEYLGMTKVEYRKFKTSGYAHDFQKVICGGLYDSINWKEIPGKALMKLMSGSFLERHNLTQEYIKWLQSQPTVKFNGYAFELLNNLNKSNSLANIVTVDKQFDNLVKTASMDDGAIKGNVLCALDTSGSMNCQVKGAPEGVTSYDICVSLGVYFSELNKGAFHNVVAMFDNTSSLLTINGTFSEKIQQIRKAKTAWGGTNFQSLIELIVDTRKNRPEIPLEEFPTTLLVVSDMQFNPSRHYGMEYCNVETAKDMLREVFPDEFVDNFKFVWWYCAGRRTDDMPSTLDDTNSYFLSGFDPSVISLLLGGSVVTDGEAEKKESPSMEELVELALNQEVLMMVQ